MSRQSGKVKEQQTQRRWNFVKGITRDLVLFVAGLLLFINEAVFRQEPPRESLLVMYGGMMGLPTVLRADLWRREKKENGG